MNPRNTYAVTQVPEPETLISALLEVQEMLRGVLARTTYLGDKISGSTPVDPVSVPPIQNLRIVVYTLLDLARSIDKSINKSHEDLGEFTVNAPWTQDANIPTL